MTMEVYNTETREILNRYAGRRLTYPQCIAALNAALPGIIMRSQDWMATVRHSGSVDLCAVRNLMVANYEEAATERDRRKNVSKRVKSNRDNHVVPEFMACTLP
jgi:hypothetical protein